MIGSPQVQHLLLLRGCHPPAGLLLLLLLGLSLEKVLELQELLLELLLVEHDGGSWVQGRRRR